MRYEICATNEIWRYKQLDSTHLHGLSAEHLRLDTPSPLFGGDPRLVFSLLPLKLLTDDSLHAAHKLVTIYFLAKSGFQQSTILVNYRADAIELGRTEKAIRNSTSCLEAYGAFRVEHRHRGGCHLVVVWEALYLPQQLDEARLIASAIPGKASLFLPYKLAVEREETARRLGTVPTAGNDERRESAPRTRAVPVSPPGEGEKAARRSGAVPDSDSDQQLATQQGGCGAGTAPTGALPDSRGDERETARCPGSVPDAPRRRTRRTGTRPGRRAG